MALSNIAGARCAGKSAFDRSAILRKAHQHARWLQHGERHVRADWRIWTSYRKALSSALRSEWAHAKQAIADAARHAALEAEEAALPPLPPAIADRIADLQTHAWLSPISGPGNREYRALMIEAAALADGYRFTA